MSIHYITVTAITNFFKPATRAFGDIAIVGVADSDSLGPIGIPVAITNPDNVGVFPETTLTAAATAADTTLTVAPLAGTPTTPFNVRMENEIVTVTAVPTSTSLTVTRGVAPTTAVAHASGTSVLLATKDRAVDDPGDATNNVPPSWFKGDLGAAVRKAFVQTPPPTMVWAVRAKSKAVTDLTAALNEVAKLDVQIVVLANTPLVSAAVGTAEIELLSQHVTSVSNTGGDGKERIGVAMLGKGDPTILIPLITGNMKNERMVFIAHRSTEDAAAAVAGAIAGYEPQISLILKPVSISMPTLFSDAEIEALDKARVNWLTSPTLIPGGAIYMGEGYTLGADKPYIDIIRTIDDISFRLKAQLIRSIGNLRISRSGLRTLTAQMTAIMEPLRLRQVIESFDAFLPLQVLLDKDPASLSTAELAQISNAESARIVDALISVFYAGAIHRLNITLKFN